VQEFGSWTADLHRLGEWLKKCGIKNVVMQSTGVYWIALYEVLEKAGFAVCLANARDTKNIPGRKSDVQECQWLMKLHTYGLFRNSFRPPEEIREIRSLWRLRQRHVQDASRCIQHMQKAMTTMNVQLANAISDISGVSGQAIIRAIVKGERNPWELAKLREPGVKASEEEIARSLEGNWQKEVLFELEQAVESYDFYHRQMAACDKRLKKHMAALPSRTIEPAQTTAQEETAPVVKGKGGSKKRKVRRKARKNQPQFDLAAELTRVCGVDLTLIDGIDVMTAQTWVAEMGVDMTPWPREDHLVSWLKLAPQRQISGGKVLKQERTKSKNRVAYALRMAASTLKDSDSYLGARFRFMRGRMGPRKAIKAMAAYLARLVYRMLTRGEAWVDRGAEAYENRRRDRERQSLERRAAALGMRLTPTT